MVVPTKGLTKRSAKAKARVVAEEREKDATREGRPLVQPMRRITSMAIRFRFLAREVPFLPADQHRGHSQVSVML